MPETALMVEPAAPVNPMALIQSAIDRGTPIADLSKLLDLQERWEKTEARKAFVMAMNAFKANPPTIFKNKTVSFATAKGQTEYTHATLDEVCRAICGELSKHDLCHRWHTAQGPEGWIEVTCTLTHAQGHSEAVTLRAQPDLSGSKNAIQAVGSTVTYLQRYTLLSATGMAVQGQDNDGASAGKLDGFIDADQLKVLKDMFTELENLDRPIIMPKFYKWQKIESLDQLPASRFADVVSFLNGKRREGDSV